jgi:hypothetical protein
MSKPLTQEEVGSLHTHDRISVAWEAGQVPKECVAEWIGGELYAVRDCGVVNGKWVRNRIAPIREAHEVQKAKAPKPCGGCLVGLPLGTGLHDFGIGCRFRERKA